MSSENLSDKTFKHLSNKTGLSNLPWQSVLFQRTANSQICNCWIALIFVFVIYCIYFLNEKKEYFVRRLHC